MEKALESFSFAELRPRVLRTGRMGTSHSALFTDIQASGKIGPELLPRIQEMWREYDVDHSGVLEEAEALKFFSDLYEFSKSRHDHQNVVGSKEQVVRLWFDHFDNPQRGIINWNEFIIALHGILTHSVSSVKIEQEILNRFEKEEKEHKEVEADPFWQQVTELTRERTGLSSDSN